MMTSTRNLMRKHLDRRLAQLQPVVSMAAQPQTGWIRSIRQSLGMTATQLAQRVAEALNCRLVYAFVPKEPLEQVVRKRARVVAAERLAGVEHTMRLENQGTSAEAQDERLNEATDFLAEHADGSLWATKP